MGATKASATALSSGRAFTPSSLFKCHSPVSFRSRAMRDAACLLDIDIDVVSWASGAVDIVMPSGEFYRPDFTVRTRGGRIRHHDVYDRPDIGSFNEIASSARARNEGYSLIGPEQLGGSFRLQNARDILRYAGYRTPLGDRVFLLRALDDHGALPLVECLAVFREGKAMAGLAAMLLEGFVEIDLDDALIGPDTEVRIIKS